MRTIALIAAVLTAIVPGIATASTWQAQADAVIGWQGQDMPGGVRRYTLTPDVRPIVAGVRTRPNLVLDGYAAFKQEGSSTWLMTAELAAPDSRVDAVARAADAHALQVSAVHNHVLLESPRVTFVHVEATGSVVSLARGLMAAVAQTGWPLRTDEDAKDADDTTALDLTQLVAIMDGTPQVVDGVVEFTYEHLGTFTLQGKDFPAAMGRESEVRFEAAAGGAAMAAEFCVTAGEAAILIPALRQHGLNVGFQAVHNHWLDESPRLFFVHVWGTGTAEHLAETARVALDFLGQ